MEYQAIDYSVTLPAEEYISRFRDTDKFMKCCRECGNFGCSWACPPFSHDLEAELRQYDSVLILVTKLIPVRKDIPLSGVHDFMRPERLRLDRKMLEMERTAGGRYFAFSGECMYCPQGTCTRMKGQPCRHPELVRPSLEAYGFDIGRTVSELFDFDIKWSGDGFLPEYLTIVSGFFYNRENFTAK
ncbi:MAG: DUF2284 domain-containing protein [Duncaniella sp.]|nr:DUF2284 domain-containing protein [Duncaniella sp.]